MKLPFIHKFYKSPPEWTILFTIGTKYLPGGVKTIAGRGVRGTNEN
jgi:hypothetical protein